MIFTFMRKKLCKVSEIFFYSLKPEILKSMHHAYIFNYIDIILMTHFRPELVFKFKKYHKIHSFYQMTQNMQGSQLDAL